MAHNLPVPCPVKLGTLKNESLEARLHDYVKQGNYVKVKKLLKKGISANSINSLGQTPLFTAALLGLGKLVDVLLDYGSDPNHRCYDGSTPVHAAAFSGSQSILSKLLDAGGDLRVHDKDGRNPQSWAVTAGKESSAQMLEFIQRCTTHMQVILQNYSLDLLRKVDSPKALVHSPSKFGGLGQGTSDSPLGRFMKRGSSMSQNIFSFGFGKFYVTGKRQLGYLASLPIIAEKEVVQADDEPTFSFSTGPYMIMTNLMWGGSRVTVKELNVKPHQHCSKLRLSDLLLAEQEYSSQLHHPHLLLLMAVCLSSNLEKTRLVFERVNFGSLFSILHERRAEFPLLHMETIVHLLLQVSDALRYLHLRGFVHRTLSSYAIVIVLTGEAKLTNLEHMIESKDGGEHSDLTRVPIPSHLYKWCAPEVILDRMATPKSDIYSFCTVMQEALTDTIPWDGLEGSEVKDLIVSGQWLEADARLPKPYYDIVKTGLESRQKQRTMNLQDIRYSLKNDLKDLMESRRRRPGEEAEALKPEIHPDINICLPSASALIARKPPELEEEMAHVARSFTMTRCAISSPEIKAAVVKTSEPVLRMAQSSPVLEVTPNSLENASDANTSLCSVEINEIYTCYPELCGDTEEEEEEAASRDRDPSGSRESCTALGEPAHIPSPRPTEIQAGEEALSAEAGTERRGVGPNGMAAMQEVLRRNIGGAQTPFEYKFGKCVLDLKICQTLLQQATDCLSRTEAKLSAVETFNKPRRVFLATQARGHPPILIPVGGFPEKLETHLRNIKAPLNGDHAMVWKAVGPPTETYIPPPFRVPMTYRPLVIHSYPAAETGAKGINQSQDATYWSNFGPESPKIPIQPRGAELNYQLLHPGVVFRRRKSPHLRRGSSLLDGIKAADGSVPKPGQEIYETNMRSEERRMAQAEWTTEVKQMAKRVASGQLDFPAQRPPSRRMLESEAASAKAPRAANRERVRFCQENDEVGSDQSSRAIGDHEVTCVHDHEERDLERLSETAAGAESQRRSSPILANESRSPCEADTCDCECLSRMGEDLGREQLEELVPSPSSSLNVSEEFLTPDPDYFFGSSAPHEPSELEYSTAEEEEEGDILDITGEMRVQKETSHVMCCPIEAGQIGRECSCRRDVKNTHDSIPRKQLFSPAISPGTAEGRRSGEAAREFREDIDASLADIQDLSSISCKDSCKTSAFKTPRSTNTPVKASTPRSPGDPPRTFSSTVTKYKDYCVMTIDTTCWATHDDSLLGLPTFSPTCSHGAPAGAASGPQPPSSRILDPDSNLWLPHSRDPEESREAFPSAQQSSRLKGDPDRPASEDGDDQGEEGAPEKQAEDSLWLSETLCLGEDTERAHSSLDHLLEEVLRPVSDSHDQDQGLPDAIRRGELSCAHHGNIEMKGGAEESFSESEGSVENIEGLS